FQRKPFFDTLFGEEDLDLLEASRHVIVHRAGIIDAEFTKRRENKSTTFPEGCSIPLDGRLVSRMVNAGISAGCKLLRLLDDELTPSAVVTESSLGPSTTIEKEKGIT